MLTKSGICLNIKESNYCILKYELIFYFSSEFYMNKFLNNVDNFVTTESLKMKNKYKINSNLELYFALAYYKKIEKRGFFIYDDVSKKEIKEQNLFVINTLK